MTAVLTSPPPGMIAREAATSAVINVAISGGVFFLLFHGQQTVEVWGLGNYAFDFLPQSFMVGGMASLVPGLIARHARKKLGQPTTSISSLLMTAALLAIGAVVIGGGSAAAVLWAAKFESIAFLGAFLIKLVYGGALGALVTTAMLRRVWA